MKKLFPLLVLSIVVIIGCGKSEKDISTRAGEKVGSELTKIVTGIDSGVDTQLAVNVKLGSSVTDAGLTKTVSKSTGLSADKGFDIYFISKKKISGTLTAKALNNENLEIGRTKVTVSFNADDAKYITFAFDHKIDTSAVKIYEIEFVK